MIALAAALLGPVTVSQGDSPDCAVLPNGPLPFPAPSTEVGVGQTTPPSRARVTVEGRAFGYRLSVDGQPQVVRGMGYNPRYAGLADATRQSLYERDFAAMADVGVNTVFGWNSLEFDGLTLDVAAQFGLGVAPPYDFDWRLDYADPSVRTAVADSVLGWVARYRKHPAIRMWAIGNEAIYQLVPPAWCSQAASPEQAMRARAFADFYAALLDQIHQLDPDHPILYRDAEDSYVGWLRPALAPGGQRPWFIYGLNFYTPRLAAVLDGWSNQSLDVAVLVSEFAPGPDARPDGYRDYWATIRGHASGVLGGAVYVWFADGPETVDQIYGLVNVDGQPVDGSLKVIRQFYREES